MMQNILKLLIGLLVGLSACKPAASSVPLTDEDYKVYTAFIDSFPFYQNVPSAETIVIIDSTTIRPDDIHPTTPWSWVLTNLGDRCHYLKDTMRCRKANEPGWDSLFEQVKQSSQARKEYLSLTKFKVRYPLQLLSQFRKHSLDQHQDDSLTYYIFGLSRISYNADKTKALFFSSFICGGTCGRGELIMLEKVDQTWLLIDTFRFWIA